jgi:hypothetical protein
MRIRQGAVLETLRRVQRFLDDNAAILDSVNKSGARKNLNAVAAQIGAHAVDQDGGVRGSKGETARKKRLSMQLRFDHMRPIAEVAKQNLRDAPEFKSLGLPRYTLRNARLTAAARAMADAATPHVSVFIDHGLQATFIDDLRAAADGLDGAIDTANRSRGKRQGATKALTAMESQGRSMIKLLDSLVRPKLGSNDQLLGEWDAAKRVNRRLAVAVVGGVAAGTVVSATGNGGAADVAA